MSDPKDEVDSQIAHVRRVLDLLTDGQELSVEYMHVMMLMLLRHWVIATRVAGTCSACAHAMVNTMLANETGDWLPHNPACLEVDQSAPAAKPGEAE